MTARAHAFPCMNWHRNSPATALSSWPSRIPRDAEDGEPPVLTDLPVLVVDDERDVCEYASLLLKEVGMRAFWVLSGQEAVAEIVRAHEERDDYFAVILDWKMPRQEHRLSPQA